MRPLPATASQGMGAESWPRGNSCIDVRCGCSPRTQPFAGGRAEPSSDARRRLVGRRYNTFNPAEPIEIPSEEIEALYNPTVENEMLASDRTDTDGDGLSDLVEFDLGTSPVDYDSDGDGLPDGFEVYISQTDPLVADLLTSNPDGDCKAELTLEDISVVGLMRDGKVERYAILNPDLGEKFNIDESPFTDVGEMTYVAHIDGTTTNAYLTASANVKTNSYFIGTTGEGIYLISHLPEDSTWKCTVAGGKYYLGEPAAVNPGLRLTVVEAGVTAIKATLSATPKMAYSVWKYDLGGKLVAGQVKYHV